MLLFYDKILHWVSSQLISVHIDSPIQEPTGGFDKVKEMCIYNANHRKITRIMNTVRNLERVHFEFIARAIENSTVDALHLEDTLRFVWSIPSLTSISIKIDRHIEAVQRALQQLDWGECKIRRVNLYIKERIGNAREYFETVSDHLIPHSDWVFKFRCVMLPNMVGLPWTIATPPGQILRLIHTPQNHKKCQLQGYAPQWLHPCVCNR